MTKTAVVALGGNALTLPGQGPKVEAALRFLADGGDLAVITTPRLLARTLAGSDADCGTRIEPSVSRAGPRR